MHPRLYRLTERHQRIDEVLRREERQRWNDRFRILRLKKLKLQIKDMIHRATLAPHKV